MKKRIFESFVAGILIAIIALVPVAVVANSWYEILIMSMFLGLVGVFLIFSSTD